MFPVSSKNAENNGFPTVHWLFSVVCACFWAVFEGDGSIYDFPGARRWTTRISEAAGDQVGS